MIDIKILYIAHIFIGKHQIIPNAQNITFFVKEFEDRGLIPTSLKSNDSNILQLSDPSGEWVIRFLETRIDIVKAAKDNSNDLGEFDHFCKDVIDIWQRINKEYNKLANRISVTSRVLFKEMSEKALKKAFMALFNPIHSHGLDNPIGWSGKMVSQTPHIIGNREEVLNTGIDLNRVQGKYKEDENFVDFDRLELSIHINTLEKNTDYRFKDDQISNFYEASSKIQSDLTSLIINHIS